MFLSGAKYDVWYLTFVPKTFSGTANLGTSSGNLVQNLYQAFWSFQISKLPHHHPSFLNKCNGNLTVTFKKFLGRGGGAFGESGILGLAGTNLVLDIHS